MYCGVMLVAGGHYTTYALNYVNLSWYEYDDQIVTEVDPQQVENCEAYVLFYRFTSIIISACCSGSIPDNYWINKS